LFSTSIKSFLLIYYSQQFVVMGKVKVLDLVKVQPLSVAPTLKVAFPEVVVGWITAVLSLVETIVQLVSAVQVQVNKCSLEQENVAIYSVWVLAHSFASPKSVTSRLFGGHGQNISSTGLAESTSVRSISAEGAVVPVCAKAIWPKAKRSTRNSPSRVHDLDCIIRESLILDKSYSVRGFSDTSRAF